MNKFNLIDVYVELHPAEYTIFSREHGTFTKIGHSEP